MITLYPKLNPGEKFLGNQQSGKLDANLANIPGLVVRQPSYSLSGEELDSSYYALISTTRYAYEQYNKVREEEFRRITQGFRK